jgi:hypothetical protein
MHPISNRGVRFAGVRRVRLAVGLAVLGLSASVGGMVTLAVDAAPAVAKAKCKNAGRKHYKTPHKDLDRDACDTRGVDDGDGPKI